MGCETRNYRVICLSETLTPLTHMRGTAGNEVIINREPVSTDMGMLWLPVISANAIRHRIIREPSARWLVDKYGLSGKLILRQLNFLFHGGALTDSNSRESTNTLATLRELFPMIRLLGASLPNQICPGLLSADRGILICRENIRRLRSILPSGWDVPDALPSAETWIGKFQYTRADASKSHPDDLVRGLPPEMKIAGEGLMIYGGEQVNAGAMFAHGFRLSRATMVEIGCLLLAFRNWSEAGATIGGQASRGHGQLRMQYAVLNDESVFDEDAAINAYKSHVESTADRSIKWLYENFGVKLPDEK